MKATKVIMEEVENLAYAAATNEIDLSKVHVCFKTCDEIGPIYLVIEDEEEKEGITMY